MPEKEFTLYDTLAAAILKGIGYFLMRGEDGSDNRKYILEFIEKIKFPKEINVEIVKQALNHDEEDAKLLMAVIDEADRTSFPEPVQYKGNLNFLKSIFSEVKIDSEDKINSKTSDKCYKLEMLNPDSIFPEEKIETGDYSEYIGKFKDFFESVNKISGDAHKFIENLLVLSEHYLWCVPSDFKESQTVSLYDRMKITAAVAGALYLYHEYNNSLSIEKIKARNEEKFVFVSGDVSGIQKYIFDLKKSKFAAKILRARSFEIQAITLHAVRETLEKFSLSSANIVINAGGRFTLLLPNIPEVFDFIEKFRKKTERWMVENYFGEVTLNISEGVVATQQMIEENSSDLFREISKDIAIAKQKKLQKYLLEKRDHFVISGDYDKFTSSQDLCEICGKRYGKQNGDEVICKNCKDLKIFGEKFPKCSGITIDSCHENGSISLEGEKFLRIENDSPEYLINKFKLGKKLFYSPHFLPHKENKETMTFEELSEKSEGYPYIAMLKADVDNLGWIFKEGLVNPNFAKISCLSRMLDLFFSLYINKMAEKEKFIYTVFSGGDDLCVIGPWDKVIEFAEVFQEKLTEFTCNSDITVSAGITLAKPKDPALGITQNCEKLLENSKDEGKDRVTVFKTTVKWCVFRKLLENAEKIKKMVESEKISTVFLYRILTYNRMNEQKEKDPAKCLWRSHFYYNMARNIKGDDKETTKKELIEFFGREEESQAGIKNAKIPVSWVLYMMRRRENDNRLE